MTDEPSASEHLFVLKAVLEQGIPTNVRWDLEEAGEGSRRTLGTWLCDSQLFGLPERLDTVEDAVDLRFKLPDGMLDEIRATCHSRDGAAAPLWVHLIEPYGYLGIVPWERLLKPAVDAPVLRLPRLVVERRGPGVGLDVVICAAVPAVRPTRSLAGALGRAARRPRAPWPTAETVAGRIAALVEAICEGSPRRGTRVHCLATSRVRGPLAKQLKGKTWPGRQVTVYEAEQLLHAPGRTLLKPRSSAQRELATDHDRSGWLAAIRAVLGGSSADVVHFVSGGAVSGTETVLAFASLSERETRVNESRYVTVSTLTTFLNEIGAWSVGFSSLAGTASDTALRFFADALARRRPAPLLHHEFEHDPDAEEIRAAYGFLYGPVPGDPPDLSSSFLYCEPHRVRASQPREVEGLFAPLVRSAVMLPPQPVTDVLLADNTPTWVAATQRFIEQRLFELADRQRGVSSEDGIEALKLERQGLEAAIAHIQKAVASNLDPSPAPGEHEVER